MPENMKNCHQAFNNCSFLCRGGFQLGVIVMLMSVFQYEFGLLMTFN